ncbi:WbqC family protein [Candidatus Peregrinibacteria bacterium]|jgi:hypothetical protein|nr:WbqC family protein [Candidatus Peregrinibacteria bacterium]MBT4056163.1 WbqC family protein [Candidatus Peregrinibacteria bacterium]
MKLAIMQPYLFPYIGYFQLINAVDKFVVLDDVTFINKGWINRNKILINGGEHMFTVPLRGASQNKLIKDVEVDDGQDWRKELLQMIEVSYKKAPNFENVFPLIREVVNFDATLITDLVLKSLRVLTGYLGIETEFVETSAVYEDGGLKGGERLLDICEKEKASVYINPIGGVELYSKAFFEEGGVDLSFLQTKEIKYEQFGGEFAPNLSIIDILMFNSKEDVVGMLGQYDLI